MKVELDKVGADIEWLLKDKAGLPVPCIGVVGGTKTNPLPLFPNRPGYMIQEDNVALEWGIPAAPTKWDFIYSCMRAREEIEVKLASKELVPVAVASMRFDAKQLEHPQAKVLGCDSDFDVWERSENPKPDISGDNETLRTFGAHVHISFKVNGNPPKFPADLGVAESIIMGMDMYAGLASVILDKEGVERRKLYGKAGAFRMKPYGVEYRVLSPFWTTDPKLIDWVYNAVLRTFDFIQAQPNHNAWFRNQREAIVKAINTGDANLATKLIYNYGVRLP